MFSVLYVELYLYKILCSCRKMEMNLKRLREMIEIWGSQMRCKVNLGMLEREGKC